MKLEHFAYNVENPVVMTEWYSRHLGWTVARQRGAPDYTTFLRDPQTGVMVELYHQPSGAIPDYRSLNPFTLHIAMASDTPDADKARLLAAGAECLSDRTLDDGTRLIMLRDPFGVCLQICRRAPGFFPAA